MSGEGVRHKATYQDVLDAPEHVIAEVLGGKLYTQPRPAGPHAYAAFQLSADLGPAFGRGRGGPGGWVFMFEPELHLKDDILVPDLAGWRKERVLASIDSPYLSVVPDFVCEVLSPSTGLTDRRYKVPIYARESVGHLWLIDPRMRSIEAFRLRDASYVLIGTFGEDDLVRIEPFDAIELDLSFLWAPRRDS